MMKEAKSTDLHNGFSVQHAIVGRMRVTLPLLADGKEFTGLIRSCLYQTPGIKKVSANHFCDSITVHYDPQIISESELIELFSTFAGKKLPVSEAELPATQEAGSFKDSIWNPWNLAGSLFVGLGAVAIFVPLVPTVPLLLLAGACYMKGSQRFYRWLMTHRVMGKYVREYLQNKGISPEVRRNSLIVLWSSLGVSIIFLLQSMGLRILLVMVGIGVSIHIVKLGNANQ